MLQWGPWANENFNPDIEWLKQILIRKVSGIDWQAAASDVQRFLKPPEQHSLGLWSEKFFIHKINKLTG